MLINLPLIQYDDLSLFKENFGTTLDEIKSILNIWSFRSLTCLDRAIILSNLIISEITYKVSHLPILLPC